jgi:hypothetical protein
MDTKRFAHRFYAFGVMIQAASLLSKLSNPSPGGKLDAKLVNNCG